MSKPVHRDSIAATVLRGDVLHDVSVSFTTRRNDEAGGVFVEDIEVTSNGQPFDCTDDELEELALDAVEHAAEAE